MKDGVSAIVAIFTAIVGVAIIAVLVSKNANTSNVISGLFSGFGNLVKTAVSPVTGDAGFGGSPNSFGLL